MKARSDDRPTDRSRRPARSTADQPKATARVMVEAGHTNVEHSTGLTRFLPPLCTVRPRHSASNRPVSAGRSLQRKDRQIQDVSLHPHLPDCQAFRANPCQFQVDVDRVGFQNSAMRSELGFYAAGWYSLSSPPRTDRRLICWAGAAGIGCSGRGGCSCRARCGRWPL